MLVTIAMVVSVLVNVGLVLVVREMRKDVARSPVQRREPPGSLARYDFLTSPACGSTQAGGRPSPTSSLAGVTSAKPVQPVALGREGPLESLHQLGVVHRHHAQPGLQLADLHLCTGQFQIDRVHLLVPVKSSRRRG